VSERGEENEKKNNVGDAWYFAHLISSLLSPPRKQIKLGVSPDVAHELVVTAFEGVS
jgi:hypothetical protein